MKKPESATTNSKYSFRIWGGKMFRYFFIAKNNMKKQKGDMITFFIMTFISAFMVYVCLNLLVGTFRVVDTNKQNINGADILILANNEPIQNFKLKEILQGNEYLKGFEENEYLYGLLKWRKKGGSWADYSFSIASYDHERESIRQASIFPVFRVRISFFRLRFHRVLKSVIHLNSR